VLVQDLGDCRVNLRNSRSVFLIVLEKCGDGDKGECVDLGMGMSGVQMTRIKELLSKSIDKQ